MAFRAGIGSFRTRSIGKDGTELRSPELLPPYDANFDEFGPRYADLPMEILVNIFSYLTPSDRREAGLTCHRWCEAAHHTAFLDRFWLVLQRIQFDANEPPVRMLLDSFRHFPNVQLREVDFERLGNYFQQFGPHIRRIAFDACDLQERALFAILSHLAGLRSLSIRSCRDLFMCVLLFENPTERAALRQTLSGVTELSLAHIQYLSDAILHRLMEIMPSLTSLGLPGCNVSFHPGLYRKFYPGDRKQPSESVLTFQYIAQVIDERKALLRTLDFSQTLVDDNALEVLAAMGPELQLERLELERCEQLSGRGLGTLLRVQAAHLRELNLSRSYRVTDSCLVQICQEVPGLRVLKMRECRAISNQGVRQVVQLAQLEVLDVSYCKAINGEGILEGIASKRNETLRELYIGGLDLSERSIIAITENLPELRVLDLGYCFHAMSDLCLQFICRNMVRLTHLTLDGCRKVSDGGLTGLGMLGQMQRYLQADTEVPPESDPAIVAGNGQQSAENGQASASPPAEERQPAVPQAPPFRISLRSRAEQEIVNDAERKRQLMEAMQQKESLKQQASSSSSSTAAFSGYSIERLQQLHVLNLAGCNSLTDVSLLFNFRLLELRELSLSACKQFTHEGIQALVRGCPAIEKLDLSECFNIKDEAVRQIVLHLHRLRELSLRGCYQLTDYSLDYIACHCHRLRVLDVRGCKQIDGEPARRLANLPQLTTIRPDKANDHDTSDVRFGYGGSAMPPGAPPPPVGLLAMRL
uniref:F-box domain-containing protein n=1 Tax=Anopheles atroparvus TaxID=41427 RepID=A0AAG5DIU5_ANOAO